MYFWAFTFYNGFLKHATNVVKSLLDQPVLHFFEVHSQKLNRLHITNTLVNHIYIYRRFNNTLRAVVSPGRTLGATVYISAKHLRPRHAYVLKSHKWHHFVLFCGKSYPAYRARLGFGWSRLTKGLFLSVNPKNWRILDLKKDFVFLSANPNPGFLIQRVPFEKGFTGFEIRRIKI